MDAFWAEIDNQLRALRTCRTPDEVIALLQPPSSGDAFFAGGGGDVHPDVPLRMAGWVYAKIGADYYGVMRAPNSDVITYVEGDTYCGDRMPDGL